MVSARDHLSGQPEMISSRTVHIRFPRQEPLGCPSGLLEPGARGLRGKWYIKTCSNPTNCGFLSSVLEPLNLFNYAEIKCRIRLDVEIHYSTALGWYKFFRIIFWCAKQGDVCGVPFFVQPARGVIAANGPRYYLCIKACHKLFS